jgi:hypothetical protein
VTTYSDLQTSVAGLLNRRDASTSQIQGWIQLALQRIQRELRIRAMEYTTFYTFPTNTQDFIPRSGSLPSGLPIPADFLELIDILNPFGERLTKQDVEKVMQAARVFGIGRVYYRLGSQWIIGEQPNPGDIYTLVYYQTLGPLVSPTDTNQLTSIAADLIIYGALTYAGDFYVDKRTPTWENKYGSIALSLQGMQDADELSGGAAVSLPIYWPDDGVAYGYP